MFSMLYRTTVECTVGYGGDGALPEGGIRHIHEGTGLSEF